MSGGDGLPATILVPTDFSACAAQALDYALRLGHAVGTKTLLLVHAYEQPPGGLPPTVGPWAAEAARAVVQDAEAKLCALVKARAPSPIPIKVCLLEGAASRVILELAAEEHADLIVIGSHGRRGLSRVVMGSVAERVVRQSTGPVLVVHDRPA